MKLSVENISFGYSVNQLLINGLKCTFESGSLSSIVGPNGSGKTTLLDLISGFIKPLNGTVTIDNKEVQKTSKSDLAKKIALVSQDYTINFPFPVQDVVMMGRHPYVERFSQPDQSDWDMVDEIMIQCGIDHLKNRKINQLSGGERQRCVFARALCQDTPILLLDEAFSNMDIRHTLEMLRLVRTRIEEKNCIVICVFHDLNLASSWSDQLIFLKQGSIYNSGPCQEVLTRESIQTVFDVDAHVDFNPQTQKKQVSYPSY